MLYIPCTRETWGKVQVHMIQSQRIFEYHMYPNIRANFEPTSGSLLDLSRFEQNHHFLLTSLLPMTQLGSNRCSNVSYFNQNIILNNFRVQCQIQTYIDYRAIKVFFIKFFFINPKSKLQIQFYSPTIAHRIREKSMLLDMALKVKVQESL